MLWRLLLCVLVYARSLGGDYVWDDWPVVKENQKITSVEYVPGYFTSGVWTNTDMDVVDRSLYRPLFMVVLNAGYALWGDSPLAFHALNLLLHSANTALLFYVILGLTRGRNILAALSGAALFAVHPVHVESVAWISGLTDPLVSFFLLSSFLLYRRYT